MSLNFNAIFYYSHFYIDLQTAGTNFKDKTKYEFEEKSKEEILLELNELQKKYNSVVELYCPLQLIEISLMT